LPSAESHLARSAVPGPRLIVGDVYSAQQASATYEESKFFFVNLYLANTRLITPLRAFCRHKGAVGVKQAHTTAAELDKS
jgi:hypothetical protein